MGRGLPGFRELYGLFDLYFVRINVRGLDAEGPQGLAEDTNLPVVEAAVSIAPATSPASGAASEPPSISAALHRVRSPLPKLPKEERPWLCGVLVGEESEILLQPEEELMHIEILDELSGGSEITEAFLLSSHSLPIQHMIILFL